MKKFIIILLLISGLSSVSFALDAPHNPANIMTCSSCHLSTATSPFWGGSYTPADIDDTIYNKLCYTCHYDSGSAPYVRTHSDIAMTGGQRWTVECRACHNPHSQRQFVYYRTSDTSLVYLAKGTVNSLTYNGDGTSTIGYTLTSNKAGWDYTKWEQKTTGRGATIYPNITKIAFSYPIISATGSIINVKGNVKEGTAATYLTPGNTFGIIYGQMIKEAITVGGVPKTVKFFDKTGEGSFAYDNTGTGTDPTPNGTCQVCHTNPSNPTHWKANGTLADHNNNTNCVSCHPHTEGFKGTGCEGCHGNPPIVDTATSPNGVVWSPEPTGSATAGKHSKHTAAPLNYSCDVCHYNNRTEANKHNTTPLKITMGFYLFGGVYQGGDYDGQNFDTVNYNYDATTTSPSTDVTENGNKTCSNLYCHSIVQTSTGGALTVDTTDYKTPVWNGSVLCGDCHADSPTTGNHITHLNNSIHGAYDCSTCHKDAGSGTAIHVNNNINISFASGLGGSYPSPNTPGNGYAICSNVYCHSTVQAGDGTSAPTYNNQQWGATGPLTCTVAAGCHDNPPASGAHATHTGTPYNYTCDACHKNAGDETAKHADRNIDMNLTNYGASAAYSQASNPPQNGYGYCQNTNCHGSGISTRGWGVDLTNDDNCTICHGNKTAGADKSAAEYKRAPGADGVGVDTAGDTAATDPQVGAHDTHLRFLNNYSNTTAIPNPCNECHAVPASVITAGHIDTALPAEITWGSLAKTNSASPNYTSPNCTNTYCHFGKSIGGYPPATANAQVSWTNTAYLNGTPSLLGDCGKCHLSPPATTGSHSGATTIGTCATCHPHVNADGSFNDLSKHVDGIMQAAGCTGCHGNPPVDLATLVSSPAPTGSGTAGAHSAHGTAGFVCDDCHYNNDEAGKHNEVSQLVTIGFYNFSGARQGGSYAGQSSVDYNVTATIPLTTATSSPINAKQCSNLYCHSSGQAADGGPGGPVYATAVWDGTVVCGDCHKTISGTTLGAIDTGSHTKHIASSGVGCDDCHTGAAADGTTYSSANHVNVSIDVAAGLSYSLDGTPGNGYGTCSTLCHNNALNNLPGTTPTWGTTVAACSACHAVEPATGSHTEHLSIADPLDTWSSRTSNTANQLREFTYGNNLFVAVGLNGTIITSPDGVTPWTVRTSGTALNLGGVAYGSGRFVVVGYGPTILTSDDGVTWTPRTVPTGAKDLERVGFGNGVFVAVGDVRTIITSPDGIDWTLRESGGINPEYGIAYGNGVWIAVGKNARIWRSADNGVTWCRIWPLGVPLCGPADPIDGALDINTEFRRVAFGNNKFVAVGDKSTIMTSPDGLYWTKQTVPTPPGPDQSFRGVRYGNGSFVVTGYLGNILTSTDGVTWVLRNSGIISNLRGVGYGNGTFVTGGDNGVILQSLSGTQYATTACGDCHDLAVKSTTAPEQHLDGNIDVYDVTDIPVSDLGYPKNKAKGSLYDSCTTAYCHSNGVGVYKSATWGSTSTGCDFCHEAVPATNAHLKHVVTVATTYGVTGVSSTAGSYDFGCGNCHPVNGSLHGNGTVDISLNPADGGALKSKNDPSANRTGTGGSTVCNKVYCHSNGASGSASNITTAASPAWNTTLTGNKCGACHGNPPQYASASAGAAGANSHYNSTGFMGKEGGHMLTVHRDNIYNKVSGSGLLSTGTTVDSSHGKATVATTMACYVCHSGIVGKTAGTPGDLIDTYSMEGTTSSFKCSSCHDVASPTKLQAGTINDKSKHVNGSANVVFATITVNSKAQLRTSSIPAGWTRTGTYGNSGSYDSSAATLNNGTWTPASKTCTVVCHNNQSATWGDTNATCNSCHKDLP